jgi:hypothetical protein
VAIGTLYLDPSTGGFENSGKDLRFTANAQLLALEDARLVSVDSKSQDIKLTLPAPTTSIQNYSERPTVENFLDIFAPPNQTTTTTTTEGANATVTTEGADPSSESLSLDQFKSRHQAILESSASDTGVAVKFGDALCKPAQGQSPALDAGVAKVSPYSDTDVLIELDYSPCFPPVAGSTGLSNPVVILGGQVFGLSSAPFLTDDQRGGSGEKAIVKGAVKKSYPRILLHAPRTLVASQTSLLVKPLFLGPVYIVRFSLPPVPVINSVTVKTATKQDITYLLAGSNLNHLKAVYDPAAPHQVRFFPTSAYATLTVPTTQLATQKQVMFAGADGASPGFVLILPDGGSPKESVAASGASYFGVNLFESGAPAAKDPNDPKSKKDPPVTYAVSANDPKLALSLEHAQVLTFADEPKHIDGNLYQCPSADAQSAGRQSPPSVPGGSDNASNQVKSVGRASVLWSSADILVFSIPLSTAKLLKQIALVVPAWNKESCQKQAKSSQAGNIPSGSTTAPSADVAAAPKVPSTQVYLLDLPKLPADSTGDPTKTAFKPDGKTSIKQGSTGPLVIKGESLDQIASATYLGNPLPVRFSDEGATATIDVLPSTFSQKSGVVPVAVRLKDGSHNDVLVEVIGN